MRSLIPFMVLLAILAFSAACEKKPEKKPLELNPEFSVNVMPVPDFWPREKFDWPEDPHERQVYQQAWAEHGTPDFFRQVHTFDGRIVRPIELEEGHTLISRRPSAVWEWVYLEDEKLLKFRGAKMEVEELPDTVRVVCEYGDPNEIKTFELTDQEEKTVFIYYNHGMKFEFVDGVEIDRQKISEPIPGAIYLR